MPNKNQHGLSRSIPEDVKQHVRQECGFGCVICGNIIIDYEHIDPGFAEARESCVVFIGKNLPKEFIVEGLARCLVPADTVNVPEH